MFFNRSKDYDTIIKETNFKEDTYESNEGDEEEV